MRVSVANRILVLLFASLTLMTIVTLSPRQVVAATNPVNILSYYVNGSPNYNAPGNESFWMNIGWTTVPLSASVTPGGGHTSSVFVKSANDGYNIYILLRWNDSQGASFQSAQEQYRNATTNKIENLTYTATGVVNQLIYNSTYYYPDRVAMLWFLNGPMGIVPKMQLNSTGAITNGTANIWHWQSNPTSNNPADTGFPGGYTDPLGKSVFPPNNSSFAEDDYTNMTGFFPIAGTVAGAPNLAPYADPYIVLSGDHYSSANKTWTVEMVRPLIVPQAGQYRVQLVTGSSYFVGFAVWNGRMGESSHIKSVSNWYKLTVTNIAPTTPATPAGGVSLTLAAATGAGLLLAGLIIGVVVRPEKKKS